MTTSKGSPKSPQTSIPRVLAVMDAYLPGRLSGGPVTSVANMVEALRGEVEFVVVTRNADLNGEVYGDVPTGEPIPVGAASVVYLPAPAFTARNVLAHATRLGVDTLYLNSFFSTTTIKLLLQLRMTPRPPVRSVVLAPRGEFSPGALGLKARKKRAYLRAFQLLGLARVVSVFQASSPMEERDIYRTLGLVPVRVAADMPDPPGPVPPGEEPGAAHGTSPSPAGVRRLAFVSRISPKKNLHVALELLRGVELPVELDIYGPLEDQSYWQECQRVMATLPSHVRATYRGVLRHEEVRGVFSAHAGFLFPTQGENYGHVVLESLSGGCPVILSDQTPWQDLETQGVGWVCDLKVPGQFHRALDTLLREPQAQAEQRRQRCLAYAHRVASDPVVHEDNVQLFTRLRAANDIITP